MLRSLVTALQRRKKLQHNFNLGIKGKNIWKKLLEGTLGTIELITLTSEAFLVNENLKKLGYKKRI